MFKKFGQGLPESLIDMVSNIMYEAKGDEPDAPDADAVARRKRLQALKDKREDDEAESSYKKDTTVRKVAGTQYGGAKQKAEVDEELKGNQHKIDANKNGKIDGHDFKLLRSKKKVVEEGELEEGEGQTKVAKAKHGINVFQKQMSKASKTGELKNTELVKNFKKGVISGKKGLTTGKLQKLNKEEYELEEELVLDLTEGDDYTHQVVHIKSGNVVGKYKSLKQAYRAADKKDNAYGAVAHVVKPIAEAKDDDLPFEPDAPKKNKSAIPGKSGYGPSAARHLARLGMKKALEKKKTEEGCGYTKEELELDEDMDDVNSRRRASINAINQGHPRTTGQKILSKLTGGRVDAITKTDPETGKKYTNVTLVKNKKGPSERPLGKQFGKDHKVGFSVKEEVEQLDEVSFEVKDKFKHPEGGHIELHQQLHTGGADKWRVSHSTFKMDKNNPRRGGDWQSKTLHSGTEKEARAKFGELKSKHSPDNVDESRGHKIIANKLADIDRRSSGIAPDYHVNAQSTSDKLKDKKNIDNVEIVSQKDTSIEKPSHNLTHMDMKNMLNKTRHGYGNVVHNEEVEGLDEISKTQLQTYKSTKDVIDDSKYGKNFTDKQKQQSAHRQTKKDTAASSVFKMKEDAEQVDEVSAELIGKYSDKANKEYNDPKTSERKKVTRRAGLMLGYNKVKARANVPATYKEEVEIDETAQLDQYIKSMGYDPKNIDKNKKVMFSKTNAFKTWMSSRN